MTLDEKVATLSPRAQQYILDHIAFLVEQQINPPKPTREQAAERSKAYYVDFCKRMAEVQAALKLTDKAAAESYGVTVATYRKYRAGAPVRCGAKYIRFCERHNISLDYWIAGTGPMFRDKPSAAHLGKNVVLFCPRAAVRQ